jgi:two-component system phosphate regulon sensor histidine kinase PhoR
MNQTLGRLMFYGLLLYFIGIWFDNVWMVLAMGMGAYVAWTLWNLFRLLRWLDQPKKDLPETFGIWDIVFHRLYLMQANHRKNKRRLGKMLKSFRKSTMVLPDATVVLNKAGEIQWFNPAATQYLLLRQPEDIGLRIDNLIRQPRFIQFLKKHKFAKPFELTLNDYVLLFRLVPIDQKHLLLTAQDITQKYRLEVMRREFVADASHELRSPLTVISGYIEQLNERRLDFDSSWHSPIEQMAEQTQRMQILIDDLLLLSRIENSTFKQLKKPVRLRILLQAIVKEAEILSQNCHNFKLSCDDVIVKGDEKELRTAFANLIFNAVHYTPVGGEIEISAYEDDQGCHVSVKDSGIGLDAVHISRLTERFYRVDKGRSRQQGGTGLGLAIVQQVLDKHNARLYVESELGKGALFRCDFGL